MIINKENLKFKHKIIGLVFLFLLTVFLLAGCKSKEYVTVTFLRDPEHHSKLNGTITKKIEKGKRLGDKVKPPIVVYDRGYKSASLQWQPAFNPDIIVTENLQFQATSQIDESVNDFLYEVRYIKEESPNNYIFLKDSDKYYGSIGQRRLIDVQLIPGYKTSQVLTKEIYFTSKINQRYDVFFTIDESQKFTYEIQYLEEGTSNKIKPSLLGRENIESIVTFNPKSSDVQGFNPVNTDLVKIQILSDESKNIIKNYYKRDSNAWTTIAFETDLDHHSSFLPGAKTQFNVLKDVPFNEQEITPPQINYEFGYQQGTTIWDNNYLPDLSVTSHKIFRPIVVKDKDKWMEVIFSKTIGIESLNGTLRFEVLRNVALNKQKVVEPDISYKLGFKRGTTKWLPENFSLNNFYNVPILNVIPCVQEMEKIKLTFNADSHSSVNLTNTIDIMVYKDISLVEQNFIEPQVTYNRGYRQSSLGKWNKLILPSYDKDTTFTALTEKDLDQWTKLYFTSDKYQIFNLVGTTSYEVIKGVPLNNQGITYPSYSEQKGINAQWSTNDLTISVSEEFFINLLVSVNEEDFNIEETFELTLIPGQGYIITKAKPVLNNYVGLSLPKFFNSQKIIGLDDGALSELKKLKLFKINNKVTTLSGNSFDKIPFFILEEYESTDTKSYSLKEEILYSYDYESLIMCPSLLVRSHLIIDNNTNTVKSNAFKNPTSILKISFFSNAINFESNSISVSDPNSSELKLYLLKTINLSGFPGGWTNILDTNILLELE